MSIWEKWVGADGPMVGWVYTEGSALGLSCACAPILMRHIGSDVPITNLVSDSNYFLHSKPYTFKERKSKTSRFQTYFV